MGNMMYPGAAPPGLDVGGGGTPAPPPDISQLQALLAGGGGGAPPGPDLGPDVGPGGGGPGGDGGPDQGGGPGDQGGPMSAVDHIREAMKHLMMAMTQEQDDQTGGGIAKGMSTLQALLASKAKQRQAASDSSA